MLTIVVLPDALPPATPITLILDVSETDILHLTYILFHSFYNKIVSGSNYILLFIIYLWTAKHDRIIHITEENECSHTIWRTVRSCPYMIICIGALKMIYFREEYL